MPSGAELRSIDVGPGILVLPLAIAQTFRATVPWQYRDLFHASAQKWFAGTPFDENLLHAFAWHESDLNPLAVDHDSNGTTDYGLMQINDSNFAALGLSGNDWQDPAKSIDAAAHLLANLYQQQPGLSLLDYISAYNAGFSSEHSGAKRNAAGGYINAEYVATIWGHRVAVQIAALAPLGAS